MAKEITDEDLELLGELGVETTPTATGGRSAREQRIIAGFEEIERFVREQGRLPEHGEGHDIFERLYAVRLDRIRASEECRKLLEGCDGLGLLGGIEQLESARVREEPSDEELLAELGVTEAVEDDLTKLVHVRSRDEIKVAEEIAKKDRCGDFHRFKPLFEAVQEELLSGTRSTLKYQDNAEVKAGDLFILDGQKIHIADEGEPFVSDYGRPDRRLRVIYDNGTESNLLLRSLQRALNKDKASRRITEPDLGPLFSGEASDEDMSSGIVYVVRSQSDHPFITENRSVVHKIGVTGSDVKKRLANAKKDPTFLLADAEIVASVKLSNINRVKMEALLHKFFSAARLDLVLKDRFGENVVPREWFIVPLPIIEQAIEKLIDGTIANCRYDAESASIVRIK